MATPRVHCAAPAKVNLALHVTGQRADGYHLIESLVVFTHMADQVQVQTHRDIPAKRVALEMRGPFGPLLDGKDDNLVYRAGELMLADPDFNMPNEGILFALDKNLPIASGIGGGSADAAAALLALRALTGSDISDEALGVMAAKLGADVPMCLYSTPLIARGTGEQIEALTGFPDLNLLLVNPGVGISTPQVFSALAQKENPGLAPLPTGIASSSDNGKLVDYLASQRNDLESPALTLAPVIGEVLSAFRQSGALLARMSGSGATCFGLFETAETCQIAAGRISASEPGWWVSATTTGAFGIDRITVRRS